MLDVEEPDARKASDELSRYEDCEVGLQPDREAEKDDGQREGQVVEQDATDSQGFAALAGPAGRQAVHHEEEEERTQDEEDDGIPVGPVLQALQEGLCPVLVDRHRPDIADAAAVEVARGRVMEAVGVAPLAEGREGHEAEEAPDPREGGPRLDEGAVGAVVEEDEGPHHQRARRYAEEPGDPHRGSPANRQVHDREHGPVGQYSI